MTNQGVFKSLFFAMLAFFTLSSAEAQTDPNTTPVKKDKAAKEQRRQQHSEKVAKELNLTPEQQAEFRKINEEYAGKKKAAQAAQKEERTKLRAEKTKAHKAVLTKEQAAKYDEMQAKKQAKHAEKKAHKSQKAKKQKAVHKSKRTEEKAIKEELEKQ
jgi:Spy/CpxP family protein refolding chaperone